MTCRLMLRACFIPLLFAASAAADVRLPKIFSSHMVLQRDQAIAVWGFAEPGEAVKVEFTGQSKSTSADAAGRWRVELDPLATSTEPQALTVRGAKNRVVLNDVLVGEVWLCSGQSNMVWSVNGSDGAEEAKASVDPRVRMFTGALVSKPEPQDDVDGTWVVAGSDTVGEFSATAYYFGRALLKRLDVPIGLVNLSWGGSNVEAWTTMEALQRVPAAKRALDEYAIYSKENELETERFVGTKIEAGAWNTHALPAMFKDLGHDIDGVIWFRREVELPAAWRGKTLQIELGPIDDEDHTYVQGQLVGHRDDWQAERNYAVPASCTEAAKIVIAVRVRDGSGPGGFHGQAAAMRLFPEGNPDAAIPLSGPWRFQVASTVSPPPEQHRPAHLYNGMLHPVRQAKFRGAIWYQGENNAIREPAIEYYELLPAFIQDLRVRFGQKEMPFGIVQLPNFAQNNDSFWNYPIVRDAQLRAFRSLPAVGLAVTLELGDVADIHPRNKVGVGERLARWALADVYAVPGLVPTGPIFHQALFEQDKVRVSFDTWGSALRARDGAALGGFVLAGKDRVFHPASAELRGKEVVVSCPAVAAPVALRYAWGNSPLNANLVNAEGLPASPFRTDDWNLF